MHQPDQSTAPGAQGARSSPASRIPALDGIRAVAIILVVACHVQIFIHPLSGVVAYFCTEIAWLGVYLFFVLSGYLIGRLTLSEIETTGGLKLSAFWSRRALRTWPLYFLALFANYWRASYARPRTPPLLSYVTFTQIFFRMNYFIESWSLSIEELFYFMLPIFLIVVVRLAGRRRIGAASILLMSLCYLYRYRTGYTLHPASTFDSLFMGVLIAHSELSDNTCFNYLRRRAYPTLIAGITIISLLFALGGRDEFRQFQGFLAIGLGMILVAALNPETLFSRLLGAKLFRVIALSSYSTYLSHMFVIRRLSVSRLRPAVPSGLRGWGAFVVSSVAALVFGWLIYRLIEKPGLRLREVLVPRRRAPRRAVAGDEPGLSHLPPAADAACVNAEIVS
ncbi:MAG: acyltransferase family protein [Pyrinomonadaceae bacterium]